jgi:hypothetical protein
LRDCVSTTVSSATSGRFGTLLRWLGVTLVVLLVLQLLAVLSVSNWGEESFRQLLATTLVTQSPMAFVGMLLMLIGQRLDEPVPGRTPLRWFVAVVSTVLALGLLVTIPVSISGDRAVSDQANQALLAQRGQLEMAKAQLENPQVLEQVIAQGVQAGQISADASDADKKKAAQAFMNRQLSQAEEQLKQAESRRDLAANQRRIGGTGTAVVLVVAFGLLALVAVL